MTDAKLSRPIQGKMALLLHRFVQRSDRRKRVVIALRDVLYAVRSVTTWGGGLGRGPQNERAAGRLNRACYALDSFIYNIETELWAVGTLDAVEFAEWQVRS